MKILHLPSAVGQHAWHLAQGEKTFGNDSRVLVTDSSYIKYPSDINIDLSGTRSRIVKLALLAKEFMGLRKQFDVFHFNWGTSLLTSRSQNIHHLDLPFYASKAKLFVTYNGCDARQRFPSLANGGLSACSECTSTGCKDGSLDKSRASGIEKMSRYVDHIWALNPDLMQFLPPEKSSFLPYAVATPKDEPCWPQNNRPLKLIHAPTDRGIKGTTYVIDAVSRLNEKYPDCIDLQLVEGMSHAQAMEQFRHADLVVDQLFAGWYGAFAVECMLLGKPVVARIEKNDLQHIPPAMSTELMSSVIHAEPSSLHDVLKHCVENRSLMLRFAQSGYDYAKRWHDPRHVASITLHQYGALPQ